MPEINAKDMSCRVRIVCSNYRAWKSSLDEAPPCTYIVKSLLLESIPSGKSPTICTSWGQLHREPAITEMWSVEVHLELDIESATNSLFPGQPTAWGSTQSTVMQSTLLNIWFCFAFHLQKEPQRPNMSSSPWTQDQQHEDNFPGSWLTWSCSLHTHTPYPISFLLVTKSCPGWCYLIAEGLNKSI